MPGVRGFWVAAGLSLNGFGGAGGHRPGARGLDHGGRAGVDVQAVSGVALRRALPRSRVRGRAARETYTDYYRLRYPFDADEAGRPRRLTPLHGRLQEVGAVVRDEERLGARRLLPAGRPWRRAGRDQRAFGWARPP